MSAADKIREDADAMTAQVGDETVRRMCRQLLERASAFATHSSLRGSDPIAMVLKQTACEMANLSKIGPRHPKEFCLAIMTATALRYWQRLPVASLERSMLAQTFKFLQFSPSQLPADEMLLLDCGRA